MPDSELSVGKDVQSGPVFVAVAFVVAGAMFVAVAVVVAVVVAGVGALATLRDIDAVLDEEAGDGFDVVDDSGTCAGDVNVPR